MRDPLSRAEHYRKLAVKYRELAKFAQPAYLGDFYRRIAVRYAFMAQEVSERANKDGLTPERRVRPEPFGPQGQTEDVSIDVRKRREKVGGEHACTSEPLKFDQHGVPLDGFERFVETTMVGRSGSCSFGLKWKESPSAGFPQYFKQEGDKMVAIPASQVPTETELPTQTFAPATPGKPYTSPSEPGTAWTSPGPKSGPFTVVLSDGSQVTYYWYRFVDQPALQHLKLPANEKARLQAMVQQIQADWPITRDYMAPPSSGTLATLDSALIVTPPKGMEVGYVPIVTRQEYAPPQAR